LSIVKLKCEVLRRNTEEWNTLRKGGGGGREERDGCCALKIGAGGV